MAKKNAREVIRLKSTESGYFYITKKNKKTQTEKLQLKKFDPMVRKHVLFKETK